MSNIAPINRGNGVPAPIARRADAPQASGDAPTRGTDSVELSSTSQLLSRLAELPDVRQDLVDRVKAQIAKGDYDTPEKLDKALDAMIDEVA